MLGVSISFMLLLLLLLLKVGGPGIPSGCAGWSVLDQEDHDGLLVLPFFGILSLPGVCSVVSKILLGLGGVEDLSLIHFRDFCIMQKL